MGSERVKLTHLHPAHRAAMPLLTEPNIAFDPVAIAAFSAECVMLVAGFWRPGRRVWHLLQTLGVPTVGAGLCCKLYGVPAVGMALCCKLRASRPSGRHFVSNFGRPGGPDATLLQTSDIPAVGTALCCKLYGVPAAGAPNGFATTDRLSFSRETPAKDGLAARPPQSQRPSGVAGRSRCQRPTSRTSRRSRSPLRAFPCSRCRTTCLAPDKSLPGDAYRATE